MTPDDTGPDAEVLRKLSSLRRDDEPSPAFTDRVLRDLARRGLVRYQATRPSTRWWAAAAAAVVVFAAGIGVGSAIGGTRRPPPVPAPPSRSAADRAGAEVNVPRVGQTEVWF